MYNKIGSIISLFILLSSSCVSIPSNEYMKYYEKAKEYETSSPEKAIKCLNIAATMIWLDSINDIETEIKIFRMQSNLSRKLNITSDAQFIFSFFTLDQLVILINQLTEYCDIHEEYTVQVYSILTELRIRNKDIHILNEVITKLEIKLGLRLPLLVPGK